MSPYKKLIPSFGLKNGQVLLPPFKEIAPGLDYLVLGRHYCDNGADALLIYDYSEDEADHERAIGMVKEIVRNVDVPVITGGRVKRLEDIKKYLYAGAAAVYLDTRLDEQIDLIKDGADRFGSEKIYGYVAAEAGFARIEEFVQLGASVMILHFAAGRQSLELAVGQQPLDLAEGPRRLHSVAGQQPELALPEVGYLVCCEREQIAALAACLQVPNVEGVILEIPERMEGNGKVGVEADVAAHVAISNELEGNTGSGTKANVAASVAISDDLEGSTGSGTKANVAASVAISDDLEGNTGSGMETNIAANLAIPDGAKGNFIEWHFMEWKQQLRAKGIPMATLESKLDWSEFKANEQGLVPVVAQDYKTGEVLMLAYMDQAAFEETLRTGKMAYYSRSRKCLWVKGETSGHYQYVKSLDIDCDRDTILAKVKQIGVACHTGSRNCFYTNLAAKEYKTANPLKVFEEVFQVILDRKENPKEGSYTNYLFDKGVDKILKKIGEEATEIVIAAKNPNPEEIKYEISDLLYHMMVLMADKGISWEEITEELSNR